MPTFTLVPKLQLGNLIDEAPASRDWKLELPALNSQAGAWELAQSQKLGLMQDLLTGKVPVKVDGQVVEALGD